MPFPKCPNYEKNIHATITFGNIIIDTFKKIKSERANVIVKELLPVLNKMEHLTIYEFSPTQMIVLDSFPTLTYDFTSKLQKYFVKIVAPEEAEMHRKFFLPVLNNMEETSFSISPSDSLPSYIVTKLSLNNFNGVRAVLHHALFKLAELSPVNVEDVFTCDEIPPHRKLTLTSGQQFDIINLLQWQCNRSIRYQLGEKHNQIKYINPFTNLPLTKDELSSLLIVASKLGLSMGITIEDNPQKLKCICDAYLLKEKLLSFYQEKNYAKIKEMLTNDAKEIKDQVLADEALNQAVLNEDLAFVTQLLSWGVSPNPLHNMYTPLMNIARTGNIPIAKLLLSFGARVNDYAFSAITALEFATTAPLDDNAFIQLLLEHKVNVDQRLDANRTALYLAVRDGKINRAKLLYTAGAKLDVVYADFGGIPLVHAGVYSKNIEMLKWLKEIGADFSLKNGSERTPLQLARIMKSTPEIIQFLEGVERDILPEKVVTYAP